MLLLNSQFNVIECATQIIRELLYFQENFQTCTEFPQLIFMIRIFLYIIFVDSKRRNMRVNRQCCAIHYFPATEFKTEEYDIGNSECTIHEMYRLRQID